MIVLSLVAALFGGAVVAEGPGTQVRDELEACKQTNTDLVDPDGDSLSDQVEACFLKSNPLDSDTDGDGVGDGSDARPTVADAPVPLDVKVAAINQVYFPQECDSTTTWDPYFTAFGLDLAALRLYNQLEFDGWVEGAQLRNRPDANPSPLIATVNGQPQTPPSSVLSLNLDPDLTKWNGGLRELDLQLNFGALVVDDDTTYDDYMAFGAEASSILTLTPANPWTITSALAYDANTAVIGCQTEVALTTTLLTLTEEVLDTAKTLGLTGGGLVQCAHEQTNGCVLNGNWN